MKEQFEREYFLRTSDFDCMERMHPTAVLDLFQDVAGAHAAQLGCGYKDLCKNNILWVLVRVKYKVLKCVEMFSRVGVKTWPLPPSRVGFTREYVIYDSENEPAVLGTSEWVLMDSVSRKLVPTEDVYKLDNYRTDKCFDGRLFKIKDFADDGTEYEVCPAFSQIDINGHVNNTKYANFVLDAMPLCEGEEIDTLQIDYRKEVKGGTLLKIHTLREEKVLSARGTDSDGNIMFMCRIELK